MDMDRQARGFGTLMVLGFWFLVLALGAPVADHTLRALTLTLLGVAMLMLYLRSSGEGSFRRAVGNNNWVFPAVLVMAIFCAGMNSFNPYHPDPPLIGLKVFFGGEAPIHDPYAGGSIWGMVNRFYCGDGFTNGGMHAPWASALWCTPAAFVSYTDDAVEFPRGLVGMFSGKR